MVRAIFFFKIKIIEASRKYSGDLEAGDQLGSYSKNSKGGDRLERYFSLRAIGKEIDK